MSTAAGTVCPRCGTAVAAAQEYCLACGLRLPGRFRLGPSPIETRDLRLRIAALAAVAVAGAAVAIAAVGRDEGPEPIVTATGGSVTTPSPTGLRARLATWPRTARGWTIVLVSVPKPKGRDEAVAIAQQARTRGLRGIGVLDSSRFASLRPGYWMAFTGRYASEAEATGSLRRARVVVKGARVQQVEP